MQRRIILFWAFVLFFLNFGFLGCCKRDKPVWRDLPIRLQVQNEAEGNAADFYNHLFRGVKFFETTYSEDASIKVGSHAFDLSDLKIGNTQTWMDSDGYLIAAKISIEEKYYNEAVCEKIFAHELMHALGYFQHDDHGLMMKVGHNERSLEELFGDDLREWLIENYNLEKETL